MSKLIDLSGKRFYNITVIDRSGTHISQNGKKFVTWNCVCDCGNKFVAIGNNIKRGKHKTCGCQSFTQRYENLVGKTYGYLTVIEKTDIKRAKKGIYWKCRCSCGKEVVINGNDIRYGNTISCGCSKVNRFKTHGLSDTRLYSIWTDMKQRCLNRNAKAFDYYGKKGITICDEWLDFVKFYEWSMSNGYKDDLTIDRIDVNGDYSPDNCRWVDMTTQLNNTSRNHFITKDGERKTVAQWAHSLDLSPQAIFSRLRRGWSEVDAISMGRMVRKR